MGWSSPKAMQAPVLEALHIFDDYLLAHQHVHQRRTQRVLSRHELRRRLRPCWGTAPSADPMRTTSTRGKRARSSCGAVLRVGHRSIRCATCHAVVWLETEFSRHCDVLRASNALPLSVTTEAPARHTTALLPKVQAWYDSFHARKRGRVQASVVNLPIPHATESGSALATPTPGLEWLTGAQLFVVIRGNGHCHSGVCSRLPLQDGNSGCAPRSELRQQQRRHCCRCR